MTYKKDKLTTGVLTVEAVIDVSCKVLGHIPAPVYVEQDGNCDDYYCKRCGASI